MDILLGQYKGLKATIPVITYTEDDVNAQIGTLLAGNPTRVNKEGPVAMGDTAVIDYEGFKDGVPFDGGKAEKYPLGIGSGALRSRLLVWRLAKTATSTFPSRSSIMHRIWQEKKLYLK